ncbi:hypothetical protein [Synechococcus phage BUCT-ZZ01]|nr:hypothetical protein [Synechococcus phage BUCT-ZZ01]
MFLNVLYTIYWLLPIAGLAIGFYMDMEDINKEKKTDNCFTIQLPIVLCLFALFLSGITKIISSFWI